VSQLNYDVINQQLAESRQKFQQRFEEAVKLSAKDRKILYKRWRQEMGDIAAREVAMYVESFKRGDNPKTRERPKWFTSQITSTTQSTTSKAQSSASKQSSLL
jgi:hypothetical protein